LNECENKPTVCNICGNSFGVDEDAASHLMKCVAPCPLKCGEVKYYITFYISYHYITLYILQCMYHIILHCIYHIIILHSINHIIILHSIYHIILHCMYHIIILHSIYHIILHCIYHIIISHCILLCRRRKFRWWNTWMKGSVWTSTSSSSWLSYTLQQRRVVAALQLSSPSPKSPISRKDFWHWRTNQTERIECWWVVIYIVTLNTWVIRKS